MQTYASRLSFQIRSITLDRRASSFAVGSIEGRCAVTPLVGGGDGIAKAPFTFKCHTVRLEPPSRTAVAYPVNDVAAHPHHVATLATCGGDGGLCIWDTLHKKALMRTPLLSESLTSCGFLSTGRGIAFASSYDWSNGVRERTSGSPPDDHAVHCMSLSAKQTVFTQTSGRRR